jgi:hypothetical protein
MDGTMTTSRALTLLAVPTALVGALLAGCSPDLLAPQAAPATSTAPAQPTWWPTPGAAAPTTTETDAAEAAGLAVYPLAEGGIVFDPAQPLLDSIKADIGATVAQAIADEGGNRTQGLSAAILSEADAATRFTGRKVVIVFGAVGMRTSDGDPELLFSAYTAGGNPELGHASLSTSKDQTVAATQAWIATQPDAALWDVVVAAGQ